MTETIIVWWLIISLGGHRGSVAIPQPSHKACEATAQQILEAYNQLYMEGYPTHICVQGVR